MWIRAYLTLLLTFLSFSTLAFDEARFATSLGLEIISEGNPYNFLGVNTMYANDSLSRQMMVMTDVPAELKEMRIIRAKGYLIVEIPKSPTTYISMALVGIGEEEIKQKITTTSVWEKILHELDPFKKAYSGEDPDCAYGTPATPGIGELAAAYGTNFLKGTLKCVSNVLHGVWDSTGGRVAGFIEGVGNLINDPKGFWDKKVEGMKNMVDFVSNFDTKMKEMLGTFAKIPAETKVQMACSFIGNLGADALLAVLAGGAGLGTLVFRMEQYISRMVSLEKVFSVLEKMGKLRSIPPTFFDRLSAAKIPQSTIDTMTVFAKHNIPDLLQGVMSCAL